MADTGASAAGTIGRADDAAERRADAVADRVVRRTRSRSDEASVSENPQNALVLRRKFRIETKDQATDVASAWTVSAAGGSGPLRTWAGSADFYGTFASWPEADQAVALTTGASPRRKYFGTVVRGTVRTAIFWDYADQKFVLGDGSAAEDVKFERYYAEGLGNHVLNLAYDKPGTLFKGTEYLAKQDLGELVAQEKKIAPDRERQANLRFSFGTASGNVLTDRKFRTRKSAGPPADVAQITFPRGGTSLATSAGFEEDIKIVLGFIETAAARVRRPGGEIRIVLIDDLSTKNSGCWTTSRSLLRCWDWRVPRSPFISRAIGTTPRLGSRRCPRS